MGRPYGACSECRFKRRKCEYNSAGQRCGRCRELNLTSCNIPRLRAKSRVANRTAQPSAAPVPTALPPLGSQSVISYDWRQLFHDDYRLVIGIDIGTRFTSACWSRLHRNATLAPGRIVETKSLSIGGTHLIPTEAAIVPHHSSEKNTAALLVFGSSVEERLGRREIEDKNVFRLLKLSLVPINENRFSEDALMMKEVRTAHTNALLSSPTQNIEVSYEYDDNNRLVTIDSVDDVFQEYLGYLWDNIKQDIRVASNLSTADLYWVIANKTDVTVAVPAIWSSITIDHFLRLLAAAGFPKVHIKSEPKCAAAVIALSEQRRLIETYPPQHQAAAMEHLKKVTKIVLDIGHGTAVRISSSLSYLSLLPLHVLTFLQDLTTCRIQEIDPKLKLSTLVMGTGNLWGAQRLNDLFKDMVKHLLGDQFQTVLQQIGPDSNATEDMLLEPLARGFEKAKRGFSASTTRDTTITFDSEYRLPTIPGLPLGPKWITLSPREMAQIFDAWIPHVRELIENQLSEILARERAEDDIIEIVAVGGGSLSPYTISKLQAAYPNFTVTGAEQTS